MDIDVNSVKVGQNSDIWRSYDDIKKGRSCIRLRKALEYVEGEKVLDFGCSYGYLSYHLAQKGYKVTGLDISEARINKAKQVFQHENIKFIAGSLESLEPESFDCILFLEVIEHCKDPYETVQQLYKLLKTNGTLIISTPNAHYYGLLINGLKQYFKKSKLKEVNRIESVKTPGDVNDHIYAWTFETLYRLLNYVGFKHVKSSIVGARPINIAGIKILPFFQEMDFLEPVLRPYLLNIVFKVKKV